MEDRPGVQPDELLDALSANAVGLLEAVAVPAYIVDNDRRVRWQNAASKELVGDLRGRLEGSSQVAPEDLDRARVELSVLRRDGALVRVAVSSVPLKNPAGAMIGSFGLVQVLGELGPASERPPRLSPRERETLALLAAGHSTSEMAERMAISKETVRNHVKRVLRGLDARSRVEAVAKARRAGLV
ncbi:MAG TPA: LuxR C-terminal-related transcriptional regulator [Gaiellaceae bacterium]|nr:LuxR C-terminal-related transcriptional regulator [Gaiellaceae bacterium]